MPGRHAADASGLLTTTIQLGQAIGVAVFAAAAVFRHALAVTMSWLAVAIAVAAAAGIPVARPVRATAGGDDYPGA